MLQITQIQQVTDLTIKFQSTYFFSFGDIFFFFLNAQKSWHFLVLRLHLPFFSIFKSGYIAIRLLLVISSGTHRCNCMTPNSKLMCFTNEELCTTRLTSIYTRLKVNLD